MAVYFVCSILLLTVAVQLASVEGGCYGKNKHLKKEIPVHKRYFNHRVAPVLKEADFPVAFDCACHNE